jgi:hypothetical protein
MIQICSTLGDDSHSSPTSEMNLRRKLQSTAGCGEKDVSDAGPDSIRCITTVDRNSPNTDKYHPDGIYHILGDRMGLPCPTGLAEIHPCE